VVVRRSTRTLATRKGAEPSAEREVYAVPLTKPQRDELDRRLDELDREGPVGIPWEEVPGLMQVLQIQSSSLRALVALTRMD
jgi:Putative addiction module component